MVKPSIASALDPSENGIHSPPVNSFNTQCRRPGRAQKTGLLSFAPLLALLAVPCIAGQKGPTIPDFTFIQASDVHAPMPQSKTTLARLAGLGEIDLAPFGVKVPKPSFAIVTGDANEFGGGSGWWEEYLSYWNGCGIPVHHGLGNHDNTWDANIKRLRDLGQGPYYSFDEHGCHFVSLLTATAQDPRPSLGEEEILWLKKDLKRIRATTPLFVFFHHPLPGTEFASRYDYDRLLDVLHPYNTVLLMAGHSHGHVHRMVEGIDETTGGSTFGPTAGFAVISIKDGMLREAYWKAGELAPDLKLLEKPISARSTYPEVGIRSPAFRQSGGSPLSISARLSGPVDLEKATYTVDDEMEGELKLSGHAPNWTASGSADVSKLLPGAHCLRVEFAKGDTHYTRSTEFFFEPTTHPTAWRAYLAASSKVTPAIADGVVYVGANDGKLRASEGPDRQGAVVGRNRRRDIGRTAGGRRKGLQRQRPGDRVGLHNRRQEALVVYGSQRSLFLPHHGGGQGRFRLQQRLALRPGRLHRQAGMG